MVAFRSFEVKRLPPSEGDQENDGQSLLCPIRALRCYDSCVKRPPESDRLFVSMVKDKPKDVHPNTISSWLKIAITYCYEISGNALPGAIKAHSVRAMAVSWASLRNMGVNAIMEACFWKSRNTFISFYLKDLTEIEDEVCKLGKLSVSSEIV